MTKILFVCSANVDRSPTAEHIYSNCEGFEVKSAGVSWSARKRVSAELLQWADVILCMEEWQKQSIEEKFPGIISNKEIYSLGVADVYPYMHPVLVNLIKEKVEAWLINDNKVNKQNAV
jgi:predicted protein tyrosine phosphatase